MNKNLWYHLWVIELTQNCNLRCKHCYWVFEDPINLSFLDFVKVCNNLKEIWVSIITLSWWEPLLLQKEISLYIKYAKKIFKEVRLTTNWTLLNEDNIQYIVWLDSIQVSIDWNEKIHDEIRWKWTFKKTINAIQMLKDVIPTWVMITIHDQNYKYFEDVIQIAKELWIKIWFERITNTWRWEKYFQLSKDNFKKVCEIAKSNLIHSTDPVYASCDIERNNFLTNNCIQWWCSAWFTSISIWADLNVYPCSRLRLKLWSIKENNLYDILSKSKIVTNLTNRELLKWKCSKCDKKYICWWCRANAFSFSWDYLEEDKECILFD